MDSLFNQKRKPLSYALNRAKKLHNSQGKKVLIDYIKSGEIRLWAKSQTLFVSDICYSFSKIQQPFLEKTPSRKRSDLDAYDIAYNGKSTPEDEKVFRFDGYETIFLWRDLQPELTLYDAIVDTHTPHDMDEEDKDAFSKNYEFGNDMAFLALLKTKVYLHKLHFNSCYRNPSELALIEAQGLECLKADVDNLFPYAREHRSINPVGRPTKYGKEDLFQYLQNLIDSGELKFAKAPIRKAIKDFYDGKYKNGGPTPKTFSRYEKEFMKNRHN